MGQKVNPVGIRLGYIKDWESKWYAERGEYARMLCADIEAREYIKKKLKQAAVSHVIIERPAKNARIKIKAARPGAIIGKSGKEIEILRDEVSKMLGVPVHISIEEVRKPALDARLVAETIAQQLEKRVMFRKAMKRAVTSAMRLNALGVKVCVSGRLGGAEIARTEWYREGRVPLHTYRADIDYAHAEALTTYGIIGVKVWIFKGEVLQDQAPAVEQKSKAQTKSAQE
ncbi:MAG: 30S ribosomal protein S3 [Gammaproteobacteria bacterium]